MMSTASDRSFRPFRLGKFLLLDQIATGGMAELYLAKTVGAGGFEKIQAVKSIYPQYANNEDFRIMFEREAQICSQLQHANIVQIYDFIRVNENLLLSMEFVDGKNLRQVLGQAERRKEKIPVPVSVFFIMECVRGLDYAHKKKDVQTHEPLKIVHRDISPQNLMVSYEGAVKIVDFGIAKARNRADITRNGVVKGKFAYMSPEQAAGVENLDSRSDIFSIGVVLFELLTQERLFAAEDDLQTLRKINECQIPKITRLNPSVPYELEKIVYKALAKDPDQRYQTAGEMAASLQRLLSKNWDHVTSEFVGQWVRKLFADDILEERRRQEQQESLAKQLGQEALESVRDTLMPVDGEMTRIRAQLETRISNLNTGSQQTRQTAATPNDRTVITKTDTPDILKTPQTGQTQTGHTQQIEMATNNTGTQNQQTPPKNDDMEVLSSSAFNSLDVAQKSAPASVPRRRPVASPFGSSRPGSRGTSSSQNNNSSAQTLIRVAAGIAGLFILWSLFNPNGKKDAGTGAPVTPATTPASDACVEDPEKCLADQRKDSDNTGKTIPPAPVYQAEPSRPVWKPPVIERPTSIPAATESFRSEAVPPTLRDKLAKQKAVGFGDIVGRRVQVAMYPEGTTMFVSGKVIGQTPFVWKVPEAGVDESTEIVFVKNGYYALKMTAGQLASLLFDRRTGREVNSEFYAFYFEYGLRTQQTAVIDVFVSPSAKIYIDGRYVGESPLKSYDISGGSHQMVLENESLGARKEVTIEVTPGRKHPPFEFSLFNK